MKKLCFVLIIILTGAICAGLLIGTPVQNNSYDVIDTTNFLRIHIKANSDDLSDQSIKYKIKDEFVNFLTPLLAYCEDKQDAITIVKNNRDFLQQIANNILQQNNLNYSTNILICKESYPTRTYDGYTLPSGIYDSIIVNLGQGEGNNWWCVVYPPLCFTNFNNSQNVVYKSKIMEIINKFFN